MYILFIYMMIIDYIKIKYVKKTCIYQEKPSLVVVIFSQFPYMHIEKFNNAYMFYQKIKQWLIQSHQKFCCCIQCMEHV